jgi:hypothetical protein
MGHDKKIFDYGAHPRRLMTFLAHCLGPRSGMTASLRWPWTGRRCTLCGPTGTAPTLMSCTCAQRMAGPPGRALLPSATPLATSSFPESWPGTARNTRAGSTGPGTGDTYTIAAAASTDGGATWSSPATHSTATSDVTTGNQRPALRQRPGSGGAGLWPAVAGPKTTRSWIGGLPVPASAQGSPQATAAHLSTHKAYSH